jgi:hypothetical protein
MSNPTITPGYGYVICSHDDPKRSHYFQCGRWEGVEGCVKPVCELCAKLPNRKPVEIPEGWELVPEGGIIRRGDNLLNILGDIVCEAQASIGELAGSHHISDDWTVIIRRKPAQPTIEPSKPAVDWSKPLATIGGDAVEFVRTINGHPYNRLCIRRKADGHETAVVCNDDGNPWRIINVPERIKREVWLNVYESGGITPWADKYTADTHALEGRVACVRVQIDCEKGEGL